MNRILNKIILNFTIILLISSCHTLEHQKIFLDAKKRNDNQYKKIVNLEEKVSKTKINDIYKENPSKKIEMAPIKIPENIINGYPNNGFLENVGSTSETIPIAGKIKI